ncbi:MAG: deoxyribodipyrimidine photo-lyase, partial [Limisphaerales bacterium]
MMSIVWFRLDLRLTDQPALAAAVRTGGPVVPLFIHAPEEETPWEPGAASRWWLHQSLMALDHSLRRLGSRLIVRRGPSIETLRRLVKETGAGAVYWNHRCEPAVVARDEKLKVGLGADGLEVRTFNAALLHEPFAIKNRSGKPFQVFTPFWRHCLGQPGPEAPLPAPSKLRSPPKWPGSLTISDIELEPKIDWAQNLRAAWRPGEI